MTSADVFRHIARQEAEWTDADRWDAWLDEQDRQLDVEAWYRATEYVERMEADRG